MKQKQDFQIVRKLSENFHPTSDRSSQHHQEVACFLNNPIFPTNIYKHRTASFLPLLNITLPSFLILFPRAGQDDAVSAASVRLVPAAAGGRPPHRLHQVQEAGHRAPGLQRGAGEGPQVSTIPYHALPYHTIPYRTIPWCLTTQTRWQQTECWRKSIIISI